MSKRFVVDNENITKKQENIIVTGKEVHHINVLRYKTGDLVYINEYELRIDSLDKEVLEGTIVGSLPKKGIPKVNITLIQAYVKADKMEYIIQKAVELGVKEITPVITKNTVVKLDQKDRIKKVERLSKIAKEAVEQCGRADMVSVNEVDNISNLDFAKYDCVLVCHETSETKLKEKINSIREKINIAVVIGPEGGLDNKEVQKMLSNKNVIDISLGERILRSETASLAILSILNYEFS